MTSNVTGDGRRRASVFERGSLLRYAAALTTRHSDPQQVIAHADRLLAWVDNAADRTGRTARLLALEHAHRGRRQATPDDDPARLIAEAAGYPTFLSPADPSSRPHTPGCAGDVPTGVQHTPRTPTPHTPGHTPRKQL